MIAKFKKGTRSWSVAASILFALLSCVALTNAQSGMHNLKRIVPPKLQKNLLLYYSFDKNGGTKAIDLSGMDFHGKVQRAQHTEDGYSGGAMRFNGKDAYISIPDIRLKVFTFSAWVKTATDDLNNRRMFLLDDGENYYAFQGNSRGGVGIYVTDDIEINEYDWQLPVGRWTHVTVTYDGELVKIYKNGKLTQAGEGVFPQAITGKAYIGFSGKTRDSNRHDRDYCWQGLIDEVAIFNRALSETEVLHIYNRTTDSAAKFSPAPITTKPKTIRRAKSGKTPLHMAAEKGHKKTAEILIRQGADVNAEMRNGETPLHLAAEYGHKEMAQLLIEQGANVNAKTQTGESPLHRAAANGHVEMVSFLIKQGAVVSGTKKTSGIAFYSVEQLWQEARESFDKLTKAIEVRDWVAMEKWADRFEEIFSQCQEAIQVDELRSQWEKVDKKLDEKQKQYLKKMEHLKNKFEALSSDRSEKKQLRISQPFGRADNPCHKKQLNNLFCKKWLTIFAFSTLYMLYYI